MSDKYVYVISPDYMMPMIEESKLYSFYIKAYHNARVGYENLYKTNLSSVLGFIFFYEELPDNLTYIIKFINFLNLIGNKDVLVVLAVNDPEGVKDYLLPNLSTNNIEFRYVTEFEIVTDSFIKKSLYGTIVLHNFEPYIEEVKFPTEVTGYNGNLPLTPILPNDIISIMSPVIKLNNVDNTVRHDMIINSPIENNLMKYMRINYIKASFGEDIDEEGMLSRVKSLDGVNLIVYQSIISIMNRLINKVRSDVGIKLAVDMEVGDMEVGDMEVGDIEGSIEEDYNNLAVNELEESVEDDNTNLAVNDIEKIKKDNNLVNVDDDSIDDSINNSIDNSIDDSVDNSINNSIDDSINNSIDISYDSINTPIDEYEYLYDCDDSDYEDEKELKDDLSDLFN